MEESLFIHLEGCLFGAEQMDKFLRGFPPELNEITAGGSDPTAENLEEVKTLCCANAFCKGVTCHVDGTHCTMRAGEALEDSRGLTDYEFSVQKIGTCTPQCIVLHLFKT